MKRLIATLIFLLFISGNMVYAEDRGFTISFINMRDDTVIAYLYHVDHKIKDYNRPINALGAELSTGKKFEGAVRRPAGEYIVKVHLSEKDMATVLPFTVYSNIVHINVYIKMNKVTLIPSQEV